MPGPTQYEVLLDFTNDTHDCATVQLQWEYGRNAAAIGPSSSTQARA